MEGIPKTTSRTEMHQQAETFVFDGEMLKTAEGRKKTFKQMVHMYNAVRNKRDALGFEKNTQVRDEDFDGYVAFRIRYFKLRKRIAELSEKGVAHAEDGTPNGLIESIDVDPALQKEFERGFMYLSRYYERTVAFNELESQEPDDIHPDTETEANEVDDADTQYAQHVASVIEQSQEQSKETEAIDDLNWMGLSNAFRERESKKDEVPHSTKRDPEEVMDEMEVLAEEYASHLQPKSSPESVVTPQVGSEEEGTEVPSEDGESGAPEKEYQKRNEVRARWKEAKEAYENAYAQYLIDRQQGGLLKKAQSFFSKDTQPQSLLTLEQAYLTSRQEYAQVLDSAFIKRLRLKEDVGTAYKQEQSVSIRAGLAHRFVIKAAHEKLILEKEYVPNPTALRTLDKMQETFAKNSRIIKGVGFVTAAGIGLATGGVSAMLLALGGRFVAAKFAFAGGAVGALAAGKLYDAAVLDKRERRKDGAFALTQKSFSVERIGELESLYFDRYKSYESALKNRKYAVVGGALAGSAAGAMLSGELSLDTLVKEEGVTLPPAPPESVTESDPVFEEPQQVPQGPIEEEEVLPVAPPLEIPTVTDLPEGVEVIEIPEAVIATPELPQAEVPEQPVYEREEEVPPIQGDVPAESVAEVEIPPLPFVFESGSPIDTVSEALFETWKDHPEVSDEPLTRREFLSEMYATLAELEREPTAYRELMEAMHITSGDVDEVRVGQEIDLRPFYEYMNNR